MHRATYYIRNVVLIAPGTWRSVNYNINVVAY